MKLQMKMLLLILFLTVISQEAAAEIYKWLDRNGSIVYSQSPPPADARPLKMPEISNTSGNGGTAVKAVQEIIDSDREAHEKRRALRQQRKNDNAEKERRTQRHKSCRRLRNNLETMKSRGGPLYIEESDGNNRILGEEDLSQKMLDAERQVQKYCTE